MELEVKILDQRYRNEWELPSFGTKYSAGLDLRAALDAPYTVQPGECILVPTGLCVYIKTPGVCGMLFARSGLGHRHGIVLGNGTGIIDADYQGPLQISILNRSDKEYTIQPGERVAQMVLVSTLSADLVGFKIVDDFTPTERGEGGFGHTGSK